jgi:hypothetical protein
MRLHVTLLSVLRAGLAKDLIGIAWNSKALDRTELAKITAERAVRILAKFVVTFIGAIGLRIELPAMCALERKTPRGESFNLVTATTPTYQKQSSGPHDL